MWYVVVRENRCDQQQAGGQNYDYPVRVFAAHELERARQFCQYNTPRLSYRIVPVEPVAQPAELPFANLPSAL